MRRAIKAGVIMIATGILQTLAGNGWASAAAAGEGSNATLAALALLPIPFSEIAGWATDDHASAFAAFRCSCPAVIKLHERNGPGRSALAEVCQQALARGERRTGRGEARRFFEHFFQPHNIGSSGTTGLLTGYYEPQIDGSLVRSERFSVPLYRRPPDLVNVVAEDERARSGVAYTHLRQMAKGLEPYPARAEIEAGALTGQGLELVWLADPVEAFFVQIQGSARIRLPDGRSIGIAYDGKNGHPYTSIGRVLIDRGAMAADQVSMASLGEWLRADGFRAREVMQKNASFVFFRIMRGDEGHGAIGALGTALLRGRSLAVDTQFHALGSPIFVDAPKLRHWGRGGAFRRLMIAQDVGSAIRGAERGDIYFGSGEAAAARAGITRHAGRFIVLTARTREERRHRRGSP
jgi:membrane-bound lytic murein transglycosylase A